MTRATPRFTGWTLVAITCSCGARSKPSPDAAPALTAHQVAYLKATTRVTDGRFTGCSNPTCGGHGLAISADGATLAVGSDGAGTVTLFVRGGDGWLAQGTVAETGPSGSISFGGDVALSADGATLAVGAVGDDSAATGINGDPRDDSSLHAGAVFVYARTGTAWTRQAYVKASINQPGALFGRSVALSASGDRLVVGASGAAAGAGRVDLFARTGARWAPDGTVDSRNGGADDHFAQVALTADGTRLVVGAYGDDGDGDVLPDAGAVHVFRDSGVGWSEEAVLRPQRPNAGDGFGYGVAISDDGARIVVGAPGVTTVHAGPVTIDVVGQSGAPAAYVFDRAGSTWTSAAHLTAIGGALPDALGISVAITGDGRMLGVGAAQEDSASTGVDADLADDGASDAGAAYVFRDDGVGWNQALSFKASNTDPYDRFGASLALAADGATLVAGAPQESSGATGVDGDQVDNSASRAGAAYVFAIGHDQPSPRDGGNVDAAAADAPVDGRTDAPNIDAVAADASATDGPTFDAAAAGPAFAAPLVSGGFASPRDVAIGDLTADGLPDLAVTDNNGIGVLRNQAGGPLLGPVFYATSPVPGGSDPYAVAIGRIDGDTVPDLAAANFSNVGDIALLHGNGDGSFTAAGSLLVGTNPIAVALVDLDGDGKVDVVTANYGSDDVAVALGNGDGTFRPAVRYPAGTTPMALAIGRLDGDATLDLAVAGLGTGGVAVLLGNGDGTFRAATSYPSGPGPRGLAIGDLDGDGVADLVVTNFDGDTVSTLRGVGNGAFQAAVSYPTAHQPHGVAIADLDGDGARDVVVVSANGVFSAPGNPGTVAILRGTPTGALIAGNTYATVSGALGLAIDDVDRDGHLDLAVVLYRDGLALFRGQ